ncbi:MAG: hypothetical protein PHX83_14500 [Acidobacteriia bacterium]|nr:hypothetical protein [Terriglobia bacterium]
MLIRMRHGSIAGFLADYGYGRDGKSLKADFLRLQSDRALREHQELEAKSAAIEAELAKGKQDGVTWTTSTPAGKGPRGERTSS